MLKQVFDTIDEPPLRDGPEAVFAKAGRVVARRRALTGLSGVAVLATIGTTVALGAPGGWQAALEAIPSSSAPDRPVPWPGSGTPAPPGTKASPGATPSSPRPTPWPDHWPSTITKTPVANLLVDLVPGAELVYSNQRVAGVVHSDVEGRTTVGAFLAVGREDVQADFPDSYFDCREWTNTEGNVCRTERLANGTVVMLIRGPQPRTAHGEGYLRELVIVRFSAERALWIGAYNSPHGRKSEITRPTPAFAVDQLKLMLLDPRWQGIA